MKGIQKNDICFSTMSGRLGRIFNTDGIRRDSIGMDEAEKAFCFRIEKRQSYDINQRKIPGHYHLVRNDTDDIIPSASVGEKFHPYDHIDVFRYVNESILPSYPEMKFETIGTLHGGGTGLITAVIGEPFKVPGDESQCFTRMVISNPCNGCGSLMIGFCIVRELSNVCIPVDVQKASNAGISIHHTKNANSYVSEAISSIGSFIEESDKIKNSICQLSNRKFDDEQLKLCLDCYIRLPGEYGSRGYNKALEERNEVIAQFTGAETAMQIPDDTAWKAFNAFSFPIFNPKRYTSSMDAAEVAYEGMVGDKMKKVDYILRNICAASKVGIF